VITQAQGKGKAVAVFDILKNKRETSKVGCSEGSDTELCKEKRVRGKNMGCNSFNILTITKEEK
jgi:hypothetical protein